MEALLAKYGYVLLFLGIGVEGEAFLLVGAYLAQRGLFHLPVVIAVAIAANTLTDQIYYLAARARGRDWLQRRYGSHPRYPYLVDLIARHGSGLLLGSRFAYGFRILIPAACGAFGMPPLRFTVLNVLAGALWAVPTALLGYYASRSLEVVLARFELYEHWVGIGLLLVLAAVLGIRHLRRAAIVRDLRLADIHALVPFAIGLMGLLNIASAILPHSPRALLALESWLPLEVIHRSRPVMLFAGLALLQVTRSLARRKEQAYWVAVVALGASLLLHVGRAFDFHHSLVAAVLLAYLVVFRRRFGARSDPRSVRRGLLLVPVLGLLVMTYGYVGLTHRPQEFSWEEGAGPLREAFRSGILTLDPQVEPQTEHAARFLGSLQIAGWLARLYVLVLLLRPVILYDRLEAPAGEVSRLFRTYGQGSLSAFAVQEDKHHLLVEGGRGLVAFAVRSGVAFACGDPLAAQEDLEASVRGFLEHCHRNGWIGCFYEVAEERLPVYRALRQGALKIAEEALIDLPDFSLAGGKRAALRSMVHKVGRAGLVVSRYDRGLSPSPAVDEQLEEISEEWLAERKLGELGFTLSRFSLEALDRIPVFLCAKEESVVAFCSWLPFRDGKAAVLDLMRKRKETVSGTMDILISESLVGLRAAGFATASLANAPLANVGEPRGPLDRGVALLFENLNAFYGYKNLFQFKKKFAPRWEGRYLVYPRAADLPAIAFALTRLQASGSLWELLWR